MTTKQAKSLQQIVDICRKAGFVEGKVESNLVKNVHFLPFGSMLRENLSREWQNVDRNINIYFQRDGAKRPSSGTSIDYFRHHEFHKKINLIKQFFNYEIPFGIAEHLSISDSDAVGDNPGENDIGFEFADKTLLSCSYFISDMEGKDMFDKIQRQRKIWWMKFSANPGRFFISELKTDVLNKQNVQTVSVKSKFPFGNVALEKIELIPMNCFAPKLKFLEELKKATSVTPSIIRSSTILEEGTLATLMDAVDAASWSEISFHRKIAPYQCSIFACISDKTNEAEFQDLAKYVSSLLRRSNISTLSAPKCFVTDADALNAAYREMDSIGVPYGILLDEESLKSGLMKLRNRDTTLSETIHLSDVPDYLLKIFNS